MPPGGETADGNTLLDADEAADLIPDHIHTRSQLNAWEARNIAGARSWVANRRRIDVLDLAFLQKLHAQMFGATWKWAGDFRRSDKNVSPYGWSEVPRLVRDLVADTRAQYTGSDRSDAAVDDVAVRFHHSLTRIHPWPNGNGRHAREVTDLLLQQWGRPPFAWGADLETEGEARIMYIAALRRADNGDFAKLRAFLARDR